MDIKFSFCLPTLGDHQLVRKFLDSLERTTKNKKNIEVLFAIDEGKTGIIDYVDSHKYSFGIKWYERPKTKEFIKDYYNYLATRSSGENIIAFNDDAWMRTQDWDVKILNTIKEYGWTVYMLDIPDTARMQYGHNFPCFPCVSRRAMNTLGFLMFDGVMVHPADQLTHMIYHNVGRVIPIRNVLIEHEHIPNNDDSKKRIMEIFAEDLERRKKNPINISDHILKLSITASTENNKKQNKFNRILNILKEG